MKTLFILDEQNYSDSWPIFEKYAVRAMICRNGKYAMQRENSGKYKIPGGTVEQGETLFEALAREVLEETGLMVVASSIQEIGEVTEIREDLHEKGQKYICHSLFYSCEVEEEVQETNRTEKEVAAGYQLEWATLEEILEINQRLQEPGMPERDTEFLKWWLGNKKDYIHWLRSKVGHEKVILVFAGGCIFNDKGEVLLQRRGDFGKWGFPGGAVELGETPEMAAIREVKEETGLEVEISRLIGVYTDCNMEYPNGDKAQSICIVYEFHVTGGELVCDGGETLELKYFSLEETPELFCKQHEETWRDIKNRKIKGKR